ncbi:MAG TPA: tetratricopeptide repeat protein [Thermoanaerobaculia bacterium]|jgi:TolA-binding protein
MKRAILALLLAATAATAAPPTTCGLGSEYEQALCAYQRRNFGEAEKALRTIVDRNAEDPVTVRSMYFLARTLMKTGRFDEAAKVLIRIYVLDKPFYDGWNCDFLLGECRRAVGK